jgi:hypothetical protein
MNAPDYVVKSHVYGKNPYDMFIVNYNVDKDNDSFDTATIMEPSLDDLNVSLGSKFIPMDEIKQVMDELQSVGNVKFTDDQILIFAKDNLIRAIDDYDTSKAVNEFTFNGIPLWLDWQERPRLLNRFISEKTTGLKSTTLWLGTKSIVIPNIDDAIKLMYALECYASACFDNTSRHKANCEALTDLEEVLNYDFRTGYPAKMNL